MPYISTTSDWRRFPNGTRADGHLFVIPDIHGHADMLEQMLEHLNDVPRDPAAKIVFLGDLIDRGPESIRAIELAQNAEHGFAERVILPGNHEGMMLAGIDRVDEQALSMWLLNGGDGVVAELPQVKTVGDLAEALPEAFLDDLRCGPSYYRCGDLILVHAGLNPPVTGGPTREEFLGQSLTALSNDHWAWIRKSFLSWRGGWDDNRKEVVIHGHTILAPQQFTSVDEAATAADFVETHARLSLDMGIFVYSQLLALEAEEDRYRFHLVIRK